MIVVHPKDQSTRFLHLIYEDVEGVLFFDSINQREQILEAIKAAPQEEYILLLGHGTPFGLLGGFIGDADADILKNRPNLVGIWCYASTFAKRHNLMGFFSGMFISEWFEAIDNDVQTNPMEIDDANWDFAGRFGDRLRAGYPLEAIAGDLMNPSYIDSNLTHFNFSRLTFRRTGLEPLPVNEDYWEYDDSDFEDIDQRIISTGLETVKRNIDYHLLANLSINYEDLVGRMEKECLRLILCEYSESKSAYEPSVKELVKFLDQEGIVCYKCSSGLLTRPSYCIHLPERYYTLSNIRGKKDAIIGIGRAPEKEEFALINISPSEFVSTLKHYHFEMRPLIRPRLENYCKEMQKRIMVNKIRLITEEKSNNDN